MGRAGIIFVILQFIFHANLQAAEETGKAKEILFNSNFIENPDLTGWYDVNKHNPKNRDVHTPKEEWYRIQTEAEKIFLKTEKIMFGVSSLLKEPLLIDDSVDEVELSVRLRAPAEGHLKAIALTSRTCPAGSNGMAFWKGQKDSGIMAQGYHYNLQYANYIAAQKAGRRVLMSAFRPPFNLLVTTGDWVTWRLLYRHQAKELCFFRDSDENVPFITQRHVDLTGIVLRSVWLGAWGTDYLNVKVCCTKRQQK